MSFGGISSRHMAPNAGILPQQLFGFGAGIPAGQIPLTFKPLLFVDSNSSSKKDAGGTGSFDAPFATLAYAVTQAEADQVIICRAGHAETISSATGIVFANPGVTVIGEGAGGGGSSSTRRPLFTIATSVDATFAMNQVATSIVNLEFQPSLASIVGGITISANECVVRDCMIAVCRSTPEFLSGINLGDSADYAKIVNNKFVASALGGNQAIDFTGDAGHCEVVNNWIYGDYAVAGIVAEDGAAATWLRILGNAIFNNNAGEPAIELHATSGATGIIAHNYGSAPAGVFSSRAALVYPAAGFTCIENYFLDVNANSAVVQPIPDAA